MQRVARAIAFDAVDPSRITVRTLVMTGSEDLLFPPEKGRALAEELPNAEFVQVSGAAHAVHVETADALVDAVLRFLEGR